MSAGDPDDRGAGVSARRGSAFGLAVNNYAKTGLGIITGPITARALGPAGAGVVAAVSVYDTLTTILFSLGLPNAAAYFAMQRTYARRALMGAVLRMSLMGLPAVAVAAFLIVHGPLAQFGTSIRVAAVVLVFLSPVSALGLTGRGFLLADGDLVTIRIDDLIPFVINAAVVIPLGLVGELTVPLAVVAIIVGNALAVSFAFVRAGVRPSGTVPFRPLLSYGGRSMFAALAGFGNRTFDQALVGPLLGVRQLGYYAVAASVSSVPLGMASALATRAFGDVGRASAGDGAASVPIERAERALRMTTLVTTGFVAMFAILMPLAIPLVYSTAFSRAVAPTIILLPGTIGYAFFLTAGQCSLALGVPEFATYGSIAGLVVTVAGLPVAISTLGIDGAALVSSVAYTMMGGTQALLLRRRGVRHITPRRADALELWRSAAGRVAQHRPRSR